MLGNAEGSQLLEVGGVTTSTVGRADEELFVSSGEGL
jgi:hypothetical protein